MPYDPTKPANNSPIASAELRNQFAGLKTLIDQLPGSALMLSVITDASAGPCLGVEALNMTVSNPPTQQEVQDIANKLDELIFNLKRE